MFYRRNSLAIRCQICEVQVEDNDAQVCEIYVKLPEDVDKVESGRTRRMDGYTGRPSLWTYLQEVLNSEFHEPKLLDASMTLPDNLDQEERRWQPLDVG